MNALRLQSAMEYLMTYGWAILVIAVVMVALFSLGILGGGTPFGTTCLAQSGYVCSTPAFSSASGNLVVTIGQATGTIWQTVNVFFIPAGVSVSNPGVLYSATWPTAGWSANVYNALGYTGTVNSLATEQQVSVTVPINSVESGLPYYPVGTAVSGTLWAQYQTSKGGTFYYAKLAVVTLKAS